MKAKLIKIREALEYSMGHIQSSIQFERNSPNCAYEARETTIKHHNDAIDAIGLVDELLAELDSPVENHSPTPWRFHKTDILDCNGCWVVVDINACKVNIDHIIKCVNAQAAINAIKGE